MRLDMMQEDQIVDLLPVPHDQRTKLTAAIMTFLNLSNEEIVKMINAAEIPTFRPADPAITSIEGGLVKDKWRILTSLSSELT